MTDDEAVGLLEALRSEGIEALRDVPLSRHTTLAVGGPAPVFARPASAEELLRSLEILAKRGLPFRCLGAGSNLLVADAPLEFAVLALKGVSGPPAWTDEGVVVEGGVFLPTLARAAAERGRTGLDWAIGVPGSVGGAVRMNAGAHGGAMEDAVRRARVATVRDGEVVLGERLPRFGYRQCDLGADELVLAVDLELGRGAPETSLTRQREYIEQRRATQPAASRSAGCMFKNPPGDSAGRLIDQVGLKGLRIGAAEVSSLHANFALNRGGATNADFRGLIERVKRSVLEQTGVELAEEVVCWTTSG